MVKHCKSAVIYLISGGEKPMNLFR